MCIGVSRIFGDNFAGVFYWNSDCFFFLRDYKLLRSIKSKMVMSTKMSNVNSWSFNLHHNIIISTHLLCEM